MNRKKVAVLFGGNSAEHEVSLQSASAVFGHMNADKYESAAIGITREGEWYHYTGDIGKISNDTWHLDKQNLRPVVISYSHKAKGFLEFENGSCSVLTADLAFPVLHGKTVVSPVCKTCPRGIVIWNHEGGGMRGVRRRRTAGVRL